MYDDNGDIYTHEVRNDSQLVSCVLSELKILPGRSHFDSSPKADVKESGHNIALRVF